MTRIVQKFCIAILVGCLIVIANRVNAGCPGQRLCVNPDCNNVYVRTLYSGGYAMGTLKGGSGVCKVGESKKSWFKIKKGKCRWFDGSSTVGIPKTCSGHPSLVSCS